MVFKKGFLALISVGSLFVSQASFANKDDEAIKISGDVKFRQMYQVNNEDYSTTTSGASFRSGGVDFSARLAKNIKFDFNIDIEPKNIDLSTIFLTFENVAENLDIMVGQIPTPFCLENSNSSKWVPFPERSFVFAFKPCIGPGVSIRHYGNNWSVKTTARQSPYGTKITVNGEKVDYYDFERSAWGGSIRGTYLPVMDDNKLIHLGASLSHQDVAGNDNDNLISFKGKELSGRNAPSTIEVTDLAARNYSVLGLEFSPQYGPFQLESEVLFNRVAMRKQSIENFWGAYAGVNWFITGQKRTYDVANGSFGKPERTNVGKYGIWQAGVRYSHLDLTKNDNVKNTGDNITAAINWYPAASSGLKVTAGYVHAMNHNAGTDKELGTAVFDLLVVF